MPAAIHSADDWRKPWRSPISPLAGEMHDRAEGRATECNVAKDKRKANAKQIPRFMSQFSNPANRAKSML